MDELIKIIGHFSGASSWIALSGLALFVFLTLFKSVATELVVNLQVPRSRAAGIVHVFMLLVAAVALVALVLTFLDAKDARATEQRAAAREAYDRVVSARAEQVRACIKSGEKTVAFSMPFDVPGTVRCPGGGCLFKSGSCNKREVWVSFAAPGGYYIESHEVVKGDMNDGNLGNLEVSATDQNNRAIAVRAFLWCDPSDDPGAGGGWANANLRGTLRLQDEAARRAEIAANCEGQFPTPEKPADM